MGGQPSLWLSPMMPSPNIQGHALTMMDGQISLERELCLKVELGQSTGQNLHATCKTIAITCFLMQKSFV